VEPCGQTDAQKTKIIDAFRNIAKAPKISVPNFGYYAVEFPEESHNIFVIQKTYMTPLKHGTISRQKTRQQEKNFYSAEFNDAVTFDD
jgi:hypothetical protein